MADGEEDVTADGERGSGMDGGSGGDGGTGDMTMAMESDGASEAKSGADDNDDANVLSWWSEARDREREG